MAAIAPFNVLVFSKTSGYRHDSIPAAIRCIQTLSDTTKAFSVTATEDASTFTASKLGKYAVVILLQCIGPVFDSSQLDALKAFVHSGGGVVAIHGAAAGMPDDDWYGKLIGAHFDMHPDPEPGTVVVEDKNAGHFIMNCCGGRTDWTDEWYNFHTHPRENSSLEILIRGDPSSFKGGKHGDDHPLAWCQEFEGGRAWFTALGHFDEAYVDKWFVEQVRRGILWAARREEDSQ